jgi:uncharacterized protein YraI
MHIGLTRRAIHSTACFAVAASLSLCVSASAQAQDPAPPAAGAEVILSIDGLIFEQPDEKSRVLMRVRAGERLPSLEEEGSWVRVQLPRGTGWVLRKIVRKDGESPPLAGFGQPAAESVTVVDEFVDVKAGPGDAYLGIRRAFRGDTFAVVQRSEDGDWVQIRVEGETGWIRTDQLMAAAAVKGDPKRGGGGEGVKPLGDGDPTIEGPGPDEPSDAGGGSPIQLEARLDGVVTLASQLFQAGTRNPRLQQYTASTTQFGTGVFARAWFFDYVGVVAEYDIGFGSPLEVPYNEQQTAQLTNTTHRFQGGVSARFPFGEGPRVPWVGVTGSFLLHRFSVQELQFAPETPPLILTNTYTGVRTALEASVPLGPVDLWGGGWYVLAPSLDQGRYTSGEQATTTAFGGELGGAFLLGNGFGVYLRGLFELYDTTFTGQATRELDITSSFNRDQFLTFTTGVLWRPL